MTRHRNGLWRRAPEPGMQWPWELRAALLLGLIVWIFAFIGVRSLFSQITAVAEMKDGIAEVFVGNPSDSRITVTVQLFRDATRDSVVVLGKQVDCLVSPARFVLEPRASQIVRIRVRESVKVGEWLRVVTILDPRVAVDTTQAAQVTVVMRLVTKMRVIQ